MYNEEFPRSKTTDKLAAYLPSWMHIRDEDSVGRQLLNIFGLEFDVAGKHLLDFHNNHYLETSDLEGIDYIYKFDISQVFMDDWNSLSFTGKLINSNEEFEIMEMSSYEDFYLNDGVCCMVDYPNHICYVRRSSSEFEYIKVDCYDKDGNGGYLAYTEFAIHHVWNGLDEIGLLLGTPRLFKETNAEYVGRLKQVFSTPGGPKKLTLTNGIANLLGISTDQVQIYELCDIAFKDSLLNTDGTPTDRLRRYSKIINDKIANTWDNMNWDQAYWKSLEDTKLGFDYLPHIWDAPITGWEDNDFQSGIGNGLDLFVKAPHNASNEQLFNYYIGAQAAIKDDASRSPEHTFSYKVYASGYKTAIDAKVENFKYTVVASENHNIVDEIKVNAHREYTISSDLSWDMSTVNQTEVVSGTKILSPNSAIDVRPYLKVLVSLDQTSNETPTLNSLTINWKDTSNASHQIILNDRADFERADDLNEGAFPRINAIRSNTLTSNGYVELAHGDFQQEISSDSDWANCDLTGCTIHNGHIKLSIGGN
jgi:hypothetical protein